MRKIRESLCVGFLLAAAGLPATGCSGDDQPDARVPLVPLPDAPPSDALPVTPDAAPDA
jgi:hypothetical protein